MENAKLSVKEKIGYGMGDAGCNIIFGAIMLFVNYFYTDIFGLAPALVGILLLSVRVIDAVTDPIMGALADRTRSKYGRFRPWLLWIAFPYALFSVLMFTTPEWGYSSKVIYAFVTYFLLSVTYTAINIPYCSLGSVITNDPQERVACQSYRFVLVGIATLLLSLTLLPMVEWFGGGDKAKGYQLAMTVLAFIGMCMFLFCFATVRERVRPAVQSNDELKRDLKDVWKNDQWVRILLLTLSNVCPGFIRMAATMYYVTWVMQQSTHFATLFISLGVIGMMIGQINQNNGNDSCDYRDNKCIDRCLKSLPNQHFCHSPGISHWICLLDTDFHNKLPRSCRFPHGAVPCFYGRQYVYLLRQRFHQEYSRCR